MLRRSFIRAYCIVLADGELRGVLSDYAGEVACAKYRARS